MRLRLPKAGRAEGGLWPQVSGLVARTSGAGAETRLFRNDAALDVREGEARESGTGRAV